MAQKIGLVGAILGGGLIGGAIDISYALGFTYFVRGRPPLPVLKYVASGLFGPNAMEGGDEMIAAGLVLHFFIVCLMAATFVLVSQKLTFLARAPFLFGPLYGVFLYYFMNCITLPLARARPIPDISHLPMVGTHTDAFIGGLLAHIAVGVTIALFARAALPAR